MWLIIDDDNEPAPENVPQASEGDTESFGAWGHTGFCNCRIQNIPNHPAKLNFPLDKTEKDIFVQLFQGLFPNNVLETIISETNKTISGDPLSYGELLQWIGLWVLMSTVDGSDRRAFWSTHEIDIFEGAPFHLACFMTWNRFENILNNMKYTSTCTPSFHDCFWEVRYMLDCWNENMGKNLSQNGFFVGTMSHCTTAHIQQTSAHRNNTNKAQKAAVN